MKDTPATHFDTPVSSESFAEAAIAGPLALGQGLYYLITGLWPLLHMRSFLAVTGDKTDRWLVRSNGSMIAAAGAVLTRASIRGDPADMPKLIGSMSAAGLAGSAIGPALRRRISLVYLADAAIQMTFLGGWAATARRPGYRFPRAFASSARPIFERPGKFRFFTS